MADDYDMPKGELMKGKKGVVTGVANHQSIAFGIASQLAAQGAEMAFLHLPGMERRVQPLADQLGVKTIAPVDVTDDAAMDAAFKVVADSLGEIDFFVHSIAFANKDELKGSFVENTTREGFLRAMDISVFSFVDCARRAAALMPNGGSIVCMTYLGAERAIPNYNTMGVAKAGLEAATRYAARDLGPKGIRVNAISAGAMRTLSLAGISGGRGMLAQGRAMSAMKEDTSMEGVAGAALWLMSDLGRSTTGEVVHVDAGFHIMGLADDAEG
ncbi:enoyl-ACP reductase FabI [Phenylobacterium sp.]|jgi:enoyl-[acyl-carrier protein] reductase I|uniref:enoyl-ACP reductase FabI n=1 Tax=Phenylobacterium sp. TaxID=1871053 RepID=UPI002734F021|nr:enoyl-ACP reductase [Phenylobacterium sp.]MBW0150591.1 enoyl-ACP reductase [Phenylobacterium sp.]MDP1640750.1 enoyl-ACP reductase [Phenylobacterium sp.]MDP3118523.1 enoyl-ACP reductase [Phenylobacterium sp.]